jgi:hypothetical protein
MSDTYRRYFAIHRSLLQLYQPRPTGHRARHVQTLVAMICGLAGSRRAHLATIADHAPAGHADQENVITRFRRWLKHDAQTMDHWFLPVAQAIVRNLAHQPLVLVMDGSVVGRDCIALVLSVVYHGRALPLRYCSARAGSTCVAPRPTYASPRMATTSGSHRSRQDVVRLWQSHPRG